MFNKANQGGGYQGLFLKGYVVGVDSQRSECKVRTENGATLPGVRWLGDIPQEQDRVLMACLPNREHYIIGNLSIPVNLNGKPASPAIARIGDSPSDLANFSSAQAGDMTTDSTSPPDIRVGDKVQTTKGGGVLGILRSGTAIVKASPTCQIMFSRYGDLGRLVTRNWEHFTDMDSTYKVSNRGMTYSLHEVFRNASDARSNRPSFKEIRGNVSQGEGGGGDEGEVKRTYTYDPGGVETSVQTEFINGRKHQMVKTGASQVESDCTIDGYFVQVHGGDKSRFAMGETSMHLDVGETTKVDITKDDIKIDVSGGVQIEITKDGKVNLKSSSDVSLDVAGNLTTKVAGNVNYQCTEFTVQAGRINLG